MPTNTRQTQPLLPPDLDKLRIVLMDELKTTITTTMKKTIDEALKPISATLEDIKATAATHAAKLSEMETALTDHSDRITALEKNSSSLLSDNVELKSKLLQIESRNRRFNLRVVGIPEQLEGSNPIKFMSDFFVEALGDCFTDPPTLDAAHRIGPPRDAESDPRPRVFIVRFHYLQDKERALKCRKERLEFRENTILLFPDVPTSIAKKRASFAAVKTSFWEKNVKMYTQDNGSLRVVHEGQRFVFDCPVEAQKFYEQHFSDG